MVELTFRIEDEIYNLAKEWVEIRDKIQPKGYENLPEKERYAIVETRTKAWREFLDKHNLRIRLKPEEILGVKVPMWTIKNGEKLYSAIRLVTINKEGTFKGEHID